MVNLKQLKVKVIGAGSVGNHIAHACRFLNFKITVTDIDPVALERMKTTLYPSRYGKWDDAIEIQSPEHPNFQNWDMIAIGTPPDSHIEVALSVLKNESCRVLFIEKPFCTPKMQGFNELLALTKAKNVLLIVGYNHCLTPNTEAVENLLRSSEFGKPLSMDAQISEHWEGIFKAHPWLDGPKDSYLGFLERGGGACGEHSHGISIWQYFALVLQVGKVEKIQAQADFVKTDEVFYDRRMSMNVVTNKGFHGHILQDVITRPSVKKLKIQFEQGFIEWFINYRDGQDAIRFQIGSNSIEEKLFPKKRPDDFIPQFKLIQKYLLGDCNSEDQKRIQRWTDSGLHSMHMITAAYKSSFENSTMVVDGFY